MTRGFSLPPAKIAPASGLLSRARTFLLKTWRGQLLLACLLLLWLEGRGAPIPEILAVPARMLVFGLGAWGAWRLFRFLTRKLLWRIRTKLIVSYLFIAVVPLVLLLLLMALASMLFTGLVAAHMVKAEIERESELLLRTAQSALPGLPADDAAAILALPKRLASVRESHPDLRSVLVRQGRVLVASGDLPTKLPEWLTETSFAGLVQPPQQPEASSRLWAVARDADSFLLLDVPLDRRLLARLERTSGIELLESGGHMQHDEKGRLSVRVNVDRNSDKKQELKIRGFPFIAPTDRIDWASGRHDDDPVTFHFDPVSFVSRLSPGSSLNMAELLVKLVALLAGIFLVVYSFALLLGMLLARSVTRSVHALSVGTTRLRSGDFRHPIPIHSHDQLGELAESFNMMAHGIEELLLGQAEKERLEEELRIARQIQMSLLPQGAVTLPGLRVAALCLPAAEVGGDYYDLLPLSESRMGVLVADVSGKGTSAALYMAELKGLVLSLSRMYSSPAKLLSEANRILAGTMDSRSFITMTYAVVDTEKGTMRYARAGHNPIIHLNVVAGTTLALTPAGMGLGLDRGDRFDEVLEEAEVKLGSGDIFLFFTDGLSEAMNTRAELFGEKRLRDLVTSSEAMGSEEIRERILGEIRSFVGEAAQHDDMTMVVLKVA